MVGEVGNPNPNIKNEDTTTTMAAMIRGSGAKSSLKTGGLGSGCKIWDPGLGASGLSLSEVPT